VYTHRDIIALLSSEPYSDAGIDNTWAHLTNHCVQVGHPDYNEEASRVRVPVTVTVMVRTNSSTTKWPRLPKCLGVAGFDRDDARTGSRSPGGPPLPRLPLPPSGILSHAGRKDGMAPDVAQARVSQLLQACAPVSPTLFS
jgi:hypothetical protein